MWLIKAVHMIPAPAGSNAEWASFWASLTFELGAADCARGIDARVRTKPRGIRHVCEHARITRSPTPPLARRRSPVRRRHRALWSVPARAHEVGTTRVSVLSGRTGPTTSRSSPTRPRWSRSSRRPPGGHCRPTPVRPDCRRFCRVSTETFRRRVKIVFDAAEARPRDHLRGGAAMDARPRSPRPSD